MPEPRIPRNESISHQFDPELLRQLCELASKEMDSNRLITLVKRINEQCELKDAGKARSAAAPDIKNLA